MANFTLSKLNKMYSDAKSADNKIFAEQRTNLKLRNGEHYNKQHLSNVDFARSRGFISNDQKIRLTKNHIHRITNEYINSITENEPSIKCTPFNENSEHDIKVAEHYNAIFDWVKRTNRWDEKQDDHIQDFIVMGETYAKIYFDYSKGKPVAQTEEGEIIYSGEFVIEKILPFELKRDPTAKTEEECKWYIHEQLIDIEDFKNLLLKVNPDLYNSYINDNKDGSSFSGETYNVFDTNSLEYVKVSNKVYIRELFQKPDAKNPKGVYCNWTKEHKIIESCLPKGVFPIAKGSFDKLTTSPRASSIIRVCRPYQVEINRSASKMAEHQITLGDDKVFIQNGSNLSNAGKFEGVRAFKITGDAPVVVQGRSGEQYLNYQLSQIKEMYETVNLGHLLQDKQGNGDMLLELYKSMKQKKKFVIYTKKYTQFEKSVFKIISKLAKHYLTGYHIIKVAGTGEIMNVQEFKQMKDDGFEIKLDSVNGDLDSLFGKMIQFTQVLQYAGSKLEPDQLGKLIKSLPFANKDRAFDSLTSDEDNALNDILMLDRGQYLPINVNENHEYMIKSLVHRTKKPDFKFLPPQIHQLYQQRIQEHGQFLAQKKLELQRSEMGMIPSGGFLITVNASWTNPVRNKIERIKVPADSILWLANKLYEQGVFAEEVQQLPQQTVADINNMTNGQQGVMPNGQQSQLMPQA